MVSTLLLPISCFSSHFFQSTFLILHLLPADCAAYKSRGDRLAPLGMSQPGAGSTASSPDTPRLCSEATSQGDIYMKVTYPSLKPGKKRGSVHKQSKDRKRLFSWEQIAGYIWTEASGGTESLYCLHLYYRSLSLHKGKMCVCILEGVTQKGPESIFLLPPQGAASLCTLYSCLEVRLTCASHSKSDTW